MPFILYYKFRVNRDNLFHECIPTAQHGVWLMEGDAWLLIHWMKTIRVILGVAGMNTNVWGMDGEGRWPKGER